VFIWNEFIILNLLLTLILFIPDYYLYDTLFLATFYLYYLSNGINFFAIFAANKWLYLKPEMEPTETDRSVRKTFVKF